MKTLMITLIAVSAITPALAQHAGHSMPMPMPGTSGETEERPAPASDSHAGHDMGAMAPPPAAADPHADHDMKKMTPAAPAVGHTGKSAHAGAAQIPPSAPPAAAFDGPGHAADTLYDPSVMAGVRDQLLAEVGSMKTSRVVIDQLESRIHDGRDGYMWDAQGWYGGDINKLWIKTEGEGSYGRKLEVAEVQALWSRAYTPWFDFQAGARYDPEPNPRRGYAVLGIQGLAPYFFETDAALFLSNEGELSARFSAEYDLLLTQRLILQPAFEVNLAAQDVEERGIGSGVNDIELGLRLRYEIRREFAPYIGVNWERKLGQTADIARREGEDASVPSFVAGIRFWF
ncbi:MAG: copper resistance protein B [Alphaproteobacteria bacterium]